MDTICIFCDNANNAKSLEHIVSESFGNKHYLMARGAVCDECNNKFSKFEDKALSNTVFVMERARLGVETKKGRNVKGKIGSLTIEGNKNFTKHLVNIKGVASENIKEFNPETGIGKLHVKSFDKSEVAASKFLLKTGLEALYTSQRELFDKYDFSEIKDFLSGKDNRNWPFLTTNVEIRKFKSIPKYSVKYKLKQCRIELKFLEIDSTTLLFKFTFGAVSMSVNLLSRNLEWIRETMAVDTRAGLYPIEYVKKAFPTPKNNLSDSNDLNTSS